ncbi:MAG: saccharopine dehydrogenase, partial [Planctomycetia bacterium]
QPSDTAITFDDDFASWTAPFVMSGINTRVVHRSNALLGYPYGREFVYDEAVLTGKGLRGRVAATAVALGLGVFRLSPVRRLLEHFVLPKPGKGPSLLQQERGFFDLRLIGRTDEGQSVRVQIAGDRDPGYGSTAKMLGEAAICLAFEVPRADRAGGFWTPASALGEKLLKRLQTNAGLTFDSWLDVPQIHCSIQINGQT